ncbi:uncharacterized protein LOC129961649 [Argiope bruennichi]|uniref:Uncharacterized protein n=1 Tax=Argiope bruennichi TaxID=94029 RepID=A0A8T0FR66_ARGBR|nr:uncharacterized protein LOC129961649 [Argiope bruennichi]KAF8793657.1 hypothetical protein HNY73_001708 [Argiope bruennichi]
MEDTSSASSDSDNALLSPNSHPRVGCTVGTQTPEMPRHEINLNRAAEANAAVQNLNSSIVVYKLDTQKPMSELEQDAKTLAIPDVVVEYIKDSCSRQEDGLGATNPAFEPQELIVVRTPSSISLRDDVTRCENGMALSAMSGRGTGAGGKDQIDMSSMMLNVLDPSLRASQTSLRCPSPTFGYRPLESETSAVYTIISPVKYVANEKELEMRLMAQLQAQMEKEKATARKFEFCSAPPEVDRKRQRLQCLTDVGSILFLIPGILIALLTPLSIIPMFILPLKYFIPLIAVFIACGIVSVLSLAVSGFLGNVVWHYDGEKKKLRPKLHCGTGPLRHFWGNGFYPGYQIVLEPEKVV